MRRRAVLVRVLAARSRPVIPPGRERTAERGHSLTNLVRCLSQAPSAALWSVHRQTRCLVRDSFCWIARFTPVLCASSAASPRRRVSPVRAIRTS